MKINGCHYSLATVYFSQNYDTLNYKFGKTYWTGVFPLLNSSIFQLYMLYNRDQY